MDSSTKLGLVSVVMLYMTAVGWCFNLLGMLENVINCWLLYLDTDRTTNYITLCSNSSERFAVGDYDKYKIKWAFLNQAQIIGTAVGSCMFPVVDRFGRKMTLLWGAISGIIGNAVRVIGFFKDSYQLMVVGSIPTGIAISIGILVSPMYTMEIAPPSLRGFVGPGTVFGANFGMLLCGISGQRWTMANAGLWPWLFFVSSFGFFGYVLLYIPMPKSPVYVKLHQDCDKNNYWQNYFSMITQSFKDLGTRRAICCCLGFRIFQVFFGVHLLSSYYILAFQSLGLSSEWAGYGTIILTVFNTVMPFLSMFAVRKYKIRFMWLTTNGIMIIAMLGYFILGFWTMRSTVASYLSMATLVIYVCTANLGALPIAFMLPIEYVRPRSRALAAALLGTLGMILVYIQGVVFPKLLLEIGHYTYLVFLVSDILSFIFAYFRMVEFEPSISYEKREETFSKS